MPLVLYMLFALQGASASLGVRVAPVPPEVTASTAPNYLRGAVVTALLPGGSADRAGIHVGDILTAIGNEPINGPGDIALIMSIHKPSDQVVVSLVRPGANMPWPKLTARATLGGAYTPPAGSAPPAAIAPPQQQKAARTQLVNSAPVPVGMKQSNRCYALSPQGWSINSSPRSDAADLRSADGRVYAGWIIHGVERVQERLFGDLFGAPPASSRATVDSLAKGMGFAIPFNYIGQPRNVGYGFVMQELQGPNARAAVIYKVYPPAPGMLQGAYIISLRMAIASNDAPANALSTAVGVTASIMCDVQFVPPDNSNMPLPRPGDVFDKRRHSSEAGDLTDYNSQLGTQYAHSPSTGQIYMMDRASQWDDNGPDGPGYYRQVGNSREKLVPGMQ